MGFRRPKVQRVPGTYKLAGQPAAHSYAFTASSSVPAAMSQQNLDSASSTANRVSATAVKVQTADGDERHGCASSPGTATWTSATPQPTAGWEAELRIAAIE